MTEFYPILAVSSDDVLDDEQLGSKPKFWFRRENQRWLFKEAREATGEDWAEKIAAEIAKLLEIPAATVELAECEGKVGCASLSFLGQEDRPSLIHGNEILAGQVFGYDKDKRQGQSDHTLKNIEQAVETLFPLQDHYSYVLAQLAAYLILDGLIGNTDRHHENWGLISRFTEESWKIEVAPSFDHASSLGRELRDERRAAILKENRIEQYVRHGRGGVYLSPEDRHGANPLRLVEFGARRFPQYFEPTLRRVRSAPLERLLAAVDPVPPDRMSSEARSFVKAFLTCTYSALCNLTP
jgi:hypothetical protein